MASESAWQRRTAGTFSREEEQRAGSSSQSKLVSLKKRKDFAFCYKKGKSFASKYAVMVYLPRKYGEARIGYSVSKKIGCAVERNRVRRRMREAVRTLLKEGMALPPCYIIFVARPYIKEASFQTIKSDIERLLKKRAA